MTAKAHLALRLILAGLALFAMWSTTRRLVALEIARRVPGPEGVGAALSWDPENPSFYVRSARQKQSQLESLDLEGARSDWEKALQLNPHYWLYWLEYGNHLEMSAHPAEAERSLLKAIELSPRNGRHHWALANFYIRQGRLSQAVEPLRESLRLEDTYLVPAAQLLLSAQLPGTTLEEVWPNRPRAAWQLFSFLVRNWDRSEALWRTGVFEAYWRRLLSYTEGVDLSPGHFEPYLNQLLQRGRFQAARTHWSELMARNGTAEEAFGAHQEFVWNGAFEHPPTQGVFDWRVQESSPFEIRSARQEGLHSSTALRVRFRGRQNPEFAHLRQTLVLDPGITFRLEYSAKSENVSSNRGFQWVLRDLRGDWQWQGEAILRTRGWRRFSQTLTPPPESELFELVLRGSPSNRAIDRQNAALWLDNVSLVPVTPSSPRDSAVDGN